jgi:quaternary ammonium compound-resistance protein SugE
MAWIYLFIAAAFEVTWAIGLKCTQGFTKLLPSIYTVLGTIFSFYFLARAVKTLPIGTAYSIWTGIGAIGTVILGMVFFQEPKSLGRLFFLSLIIVGIVGLKLSSGR